MWENSPSERSIVDTLLRMRPTDKGPHTREELLDSPEVGEYRRCVVSLKNQGDSEQALSQYKESVKRLLSLT